MTQKLRIGLSMRVVTQEYPSGTQEKRDCLAQDWTDFMRFALPSVLWIPLPTGKEALTLAEELGLQGFVLTGGNDIGAEAQRDASEYALLHWAKERHLPVMGICRGAQMLQTFCGGKLSLLEQQEAHINARHVLSVAKSLQMKPALFSSKTQENFSGREVNSYHAYGIQEHDLAHDLYMVAQASDGSVEAFMHKHLPWFGCLWHPERERPFHEHDYALFQHIFIKNTEI